MTNQQVARFFSCCDRLFATDREKCARVLTAAAAGQNWPQLMATRAFIDLMARTPLGSWIRTDEAEKIIIATRDKIARHHAHHRPKPT